MNKLALTLLTSVSMLFVSLGASAESIKASCTFKVFDVKTKQPVYGSLLLPVHVTVDENKSLSLRNIFGYSFRVSALGNEILTTVVDLSTSATISSIPVEGSGKSILQVVFANRQVVLSCEKNSL